MDDGEPTQLSSTTRVVIRVQDTNDNAPEFDQKSYHVQIPSNVKINQKLFQVNYYHVIPGTTINCTTIWLRLNIPQSQLSSSLFMYWNVFNDL